MKRSLVLAGLAFFSLSSAACSLQRATVLKPLTIVEMEPYRPSENEADELKAILADATLHFELDEHTLSEEDQETLDQVAEALRLYPWANLKIKGHTDVRGTEEYNLALGQRRADAAKSYLVALGIEGERIDTVTYGDERPVVEGEDEIAWSQNRRDELEPATPAATALAGSR